MDKKKQNHFGLGMAIFAVTTLIIMVYSMFTMTIKATGIGLDTTNELHPDFWADACFGYWKIKVYFCPMMVEDVPQLLDGGAFTSGLTNSGIISIVFYIMLLGGAIGYFVFDHFNQVEEGIDFRMTIGVCTVLSTVVFITGLASKPDVDSINNLIKWIIDYSSEAPAASNAVMPLPWIWNISANALIVAVTTVNDNYSINANANVGLFLSRASIAFLIAFGIIGAGSLFPTIKGTVNYFKK